MTKRTTTLTGVAGALVSGILLLSMLSVLAIPSNASASSRPILLSLIRSDVNQTELATFIGHYDSPTDYKIPIQRGSTQNLTAFTGQYMVTFTGNLTQSQVSAYKAQNVTALGLDEEPLNLNDFNYNLALVHANNMTFSVGALYGDIQKNYKALSKADVFVFLIPIYIQNQTSLYQPAVTKYANAVHTLNPSCKVIVEYTTGQYLNGHIVNPPSNQNITLIINAYNSVKSVTDGVMLWYYPTGIDPVVDLTRFYNATGIYPVS